MRRIGRGSLTSIAISPDERLLAAATRLGIWIYDGKTLEQIRLIETTRGVWSVAFARNGEALAGGLEDGTVRVWRVSDGSAVQTLGVQALVFLDEGRLLATGSRDGTVRFWGVR